MGEKYFITDRCTGCGACVSRCPMHCINNSGRPYVIEENKCNRCGKCIDNCPLMAIKRR